MEDLTNTLLNLTIGSGRYQIQERLGTGGTARVFKGYDTNLDRDVAIKILHEHLASDSTFKERFEQEAKFVASLNHPNIVQVYDFDSFNRDGTRIYYMVMSFLSGPTLQDRLETMMADKETLSQNDIFEIMQSLCKALDYAHNLGAIHRDVKPANIMFNERNEAVLTDFGIAKLAQGSRLTQEGLTVGTPTYMSPEQATGEPIDSRSDLYALGVILYEMIAGKPPFADDGTLSVLLKHLNEPVPLLSEQHNVGNSAIDVVILRAMAKLPEERYQTAKDMVNDLKLAFDGNMPEISIANYTQQFTVQVPTSRLKSYTPSPIGNQTPVQLPATNTVAPRPHNSPIGILAVGLAIIAAFLFIGLISQQANSDAPQTNNDEAIVNIGEDNALQNNSSESMTGDDSAESMTGTMYFNSTFSEDDTFVDYWPMEGSPLLTREVNDGFYRIDNRLSNRAVPTIFSIGEGYTDASIQLTATLEDISSSVSAFGIIFRYVDDDNYNVFAVDGLGRYSIWRRENGNWQELRNTDENWTENDIIFPVGEQNTLIIEIDGDQLTGYINGELITTVFDNTFANGQIGIYVATPPNGTASVLIDNYQISETAFPFANSMTGDPDTSDPNLDLEGN